MGWGLKGSRPARIRNPRVSPSSYGGSLGLLAKSLILPGIFGNGIVLPDSVLNSVTGDIDVRWIGALDSWTIHPSGNGALISKMAAGTPRSWDLLILGNALVRFRMSTDGVNLLGQADSTIPVTNIIADKGKLGIKATRVGANVNFFYSLDSGVSWLALGANPVNDGSAGVPIADSAANIELGSELAASNLMCSSGTHYFAEVRAGVDGAIVAQFNPTRALVNANIISSVTGENWTLLKSGSQPAFLL